MKRILLCAAIFVSVSAASVMSVVTLKKYTDALCGQIDECMAAYLSGEDAAGELSEFERQFGRYYAVSSFIVRSGELDEIYSATARLRPLYEEGSEEFCSELSAVRLKAQTIYRAQFPFIITVLFDG
jgi:hypothetical protein